VYSEIDMQQIQAELRDAAKLYGTAVAPGLLAGDANDDDDDGDGDGDETDPEEEWTLRKACAKSLDELSKIIGSDQFFACLAQHLSARMQSADWRHQECALLAIGAVAPGCMSAIVASGAMTGIFSHIVQVLQQPQQHFLIISIGCWTISRVSSYFAREKASVHGVLAALCNYLGNDNPKVRENAVSAIATITEECRNVDARAHITDISPNLAQYLAACVQSYQGRMLLIALDATEQLALCCSLAAHAQVIVPPLMQRWAEFAQAAVAASYNASALTTTGGDICVALLRTLNLVFTSLGPQVFPPFFESVVHPSVQRVMAAVATDGENEYYEQDGM